MAGVQFLTGGFPSTLRYSLRAEYHSVVSDNIISGRNDPHEGSEIIAQSGDINVLSQTIARKLSSGEKLAMCHQLRASFFQQRRYLMLRSLHILTPDFHPCTHWPSPTIGPAGDQRGDTRMGQYRDYGEDAALARREAFCKCRQCGQCWSDAFHAKTQRSGIRVPFVLSNAQSSAPQ